MPDYDLSVLRRELDDMRRRLWEAGAPSEVAAAPALLGQARKALDARAQETQARLAAIVESSQDAIMAMALDGTILTWNPGAERLYGYARAEAVGFTLDILLPPERRGELRWILETVGRGERVAPFETVQRRKDGPEVIVSLTVSPIKDASGRITGAAAIARDITERKSLEEQLRQAQKMEAVGRLAAGVAHDFNNLLNVIIGYGEMLQGLVQGDEGRGQKVGQILKAAERAASLTRQLLAFGRKEAVRPRVLDLNALVADTDRMLRRLIGEDIELATVLSPGLGPVRADPGHMEQVVMNLVVNARDAMPGGGKLTVETRNVVLDDDHVRRHLGSRPGPHVMLAVSDTGAGMDAETQARIFEPFFTTKEQGKGTGLGLATVYAIVQQSGGHIRVDSELGRGASFRIYLPRAEEALREGGPEAPWREPVRGTETILLVEDEEVVRTLVRETLEESGFKVLEATSPADGLHIARHHAGSIHLLITDVIMPGMGGRDLAAKLSSLRPDVRTLYMSGYPEDVIFQHRVLEAGIPFLQKPFTTSGLRQKVREVLDLPRRDSRGNRKTVP